MKWLGAEGGRSGVGRCQMSWGAFCRTFEGYSLFSPRDWKIDEEHAFVSRLKSLLSLRNRSVNYSTWKKKRERKPVFGPVVFITSADGPPTLHSLALSLTLTWMLIPIVKCWVTQTFNVIKQVWGKCLWGDNSVGNMLGNTCSLWFAYIIWQRAYKRINLVC